MPLATTANDSRQIISHAVRLYHRFCLSFRDTEDLLITHDPRHLTVPLDLRIVV